LTRALASQFKTRRRSALGFVLPPSYAGAWLDRSPTLFGMLKAIDRATSGFTAGLADHFVLEARARQ